MKKQIFELFVSKEPKYKPSLVKPFTINGKTYATDGDGEGLSQSAKQVPTGGKTFGLYAVKIRDAYFEMSLFYRLMQASKLLGATEVIMTSYREKHKGVLFNVGDCEILIMPLLWQDDSEKIYSRTLKINLTEH